MNICKHFAKTKISLPSNHTVADECKVCPLREEKGDCIKDIYDDAGVEMEKKTSELCRVAEERIFGIWRQFYERDGALCIPKNIIVEVRELKGG